MYYIYYRTQKRLFLAATYENNIYLFLAATYENNIYFISAQLPMDKFARLCIYL